MKEASTVGGLQVLARGALWVLVYNSVWGVAWFAFMRQEWRAAAAAIGRLMPWTADVWILCGILMLPLGAAIVVYAAAPERSALKGAVYAGLAMWIIWTLGMAVACRQFSLRVLVLDRSVDLIAMLAASIAAVSRLPSKCRPPEEPNQPSATVFTPQGKTGDF